ncbi:MAG: hypothetical protein JO231_07060 [Acidobacteria bacterium]|nr:hypothetical protein [Acidobacteriota bacterium]
MADGQISAPPAHIKVQETQICGEVWSGAERKISRTGIRHQQKHGLRIAEPQASLRGKAEAGKLLRRTDAELTDENFATNDPSRSRSLKRSDSVKGLSSDRAF